MELSYHCKVERANRVNQIVEKIGVGQIVKEQYRRGTDRVEAGAEGSWICITDTGITIVKNENKTKIVTMYVTTYRELVAVYGGTKHIPKYLHKKVDQNQSWFTKNGKTVWR